MRRLLNILIASCISVISIAQISGGGKPLKFDVVYTHSIKSVPVLKNAQNIYYELQVDTVYHNDTTHTKLLYAGNVCQTDITPYNSGTVFTKDGLRVWRVGIVSKRAVSIGIVFTEFNLPSDANLFIYNPSQSIVKGSFTSANNNNYNILAIAPLPCDTLIVEYSEPDTDNNKFNGKLKIGEASHNFIYPTLKSGPWDGDTCIPHVEVEESGNPVINAVCSIFTTGDNSSWYGTGTLINNPDHKPYIITAGHCMEGLENSKKSVFYFQYHVPAADTLVQGSRELSVCGATTVAYAKDLDLALLELNQMPPKDYRPYLAGWDATEPQYAPLKCIQHPNGDMAKVSYAMVNPVKSKSTVDTSKFPYKSFWFISRWSRGCTQGGSSGSALLNAENRIIGTLTGGSSICQSPIRDDFAQLSEQYNLHSEPSQQLKAWLDPHNQGITYMDGYDPYTTSNPCFRESNIDAEDALSPMHLNGGAKGYMAGHNSLGYTEYAEKYTFNSDATVYGVYVMTYKGRYNASHPVKVIVYGDGDTPSEILGTEELKPIEYKYNYAGNLTSKIITNWNKRETYVRFSKPIEVKKGCFVGVGLEYYSNLDSLGLYQTTNRASGNSAYLKSSDGWKPFTAYPYSPMPASIWIEPVVCYGGGTPVEQTYADDTVVSYSVSPNPTSGYVYITDISNPDADYTATYSITDLCGRTIEQGYTEFNNGSAEITLQGVSAGSYLFKINADKDHRHSVTHLQVR
ncbi:MAG: trypsin-like peptidase domain-containing protein [Paludibacteraceae bacterium]|nr:trypsin-like peptidase domain-containing protein [Paludibacteraceae bacterium]